MKADRSTYDFIRSPLIEGEKLKAYQDSTPAKIWTIGCGLTSINNIPVKKGDAITQSQSEQLFYKEAIRFENDVNENLTRELTRQEWNVLFSIAWNHGTGWYTNKRLIVIQFNEDPKYFEEIERILNIMDNHNRRMNELHYLKTGEL